MASSSDQDQVELVVKRSKLKEDLSSKTIRWGFVGTGNIAVAMAQQLSRMANTRKEAVCSASGRSALDVEKDRKRLGFARALSLEDLVADPDVDVVYVASANTAHARHCLAALRGGKHVLCEKPLTLSVEDAEALFAEAALRQRFLLDGTFSAYLPACDIIRSALEAIRPIRHVELHKKIRMSIVKTSPIINKRELGGGLFDGTGTYTVHMLCLIFGADAIAALAPEDVDVVSFSDPDGRVDWDTTVTVRIAGVTVFLTHRASDDGRRSIVRGDGGSLEFTLPRLEEVFVNGTRHLANYANTMGLAKLPAGEPDAPHGLHPGLGVEAMVVHSALASKLQPGPGVAQLPLATMRAMVHLQEIVRRRLPTHLLYELVLPSKL